jgi:hypothetical protein
MNRMANFRVRFGTMMKQVFAALTPQAMIVYGVQLTPLRMTQCLV